MEHRISVAQRNFSATLLDPGMCKLENGSRGAVEGTTLFVGRCQGTREFSVEHWQHERTQLFGELRKHVNLAEIADLAEYSGKRGVRWATETGAEPRSGDKVRMVVQPFSKLNPTEADSAYFNQAVLQFNQAFEIEEFPDTVAEVLSFLLLAQLALLGDGRNAPVRTKGKLARSTIAAVAFTLLEDGAIGNYLVGLIRALLNVTTHSNEEQRNFEARQAAAQIYAQVAKVSLRQVAKAVNVNPSTVSRWLKEESFCQAVEGLRRLFSSPHVKNTIEEGRKRKAARQGKSHSPTE